jgi:CO/xanthine dehydrogenase Mo-binding subunit
MHHSTGSLPCTLPITTAPVVANAVFDAAGVRLRQMPSTPGRVRAALLERQLS